MRRAATPDGMHVIGNPDTGVLGTRPTFFFDDVQEEICAVIEESGIVLDGAKRNQLLAALQSGRLNYGKAVFASAYNTLEEADVVAAETGLALVIDTEWTFANNITFTSNVQVWPRGAFNNSGNIAFAGTFTAPLLPCFKGTGAVTGLMKSRPEWFVSGLQKAILSVAPYGMLLFAGGTYALSAGASATLPGFQQWIAEGPTTIKYTGAEISYMVLLTLNGNSLWMDGPFDFDANQNARTPLRINNNVASMAQAAQLILKGVTARNAYSTDTVGHAGSNGILVQGGFTKVCMENCGAVNVSRAVGVGLSGSQGSSGISVTHNGINAYPKEVVLVNPYIERITSEELDGTAANVDCDGLAVFGPSASANGGFRLDTSFTVRGGKYINCRGRSIKTQMEQNVIDGPTFVRNAAGDRSIANGVEVDFQYGSGMLKNWRCNYTPLNGGSTPFGDSFSIVTATARNFTSLSSSAAGEGAVVVDSGEIINNVSSAVDAIPYLIILGSTSNGGVYGKFSNVSVKNITLLGEGSLGYAVYGGMDSVRMLNVSDNFFQKISNALIYSQASAEACKLTARNNTIPNSSTAKLWDGIGNPPTILECGNNPNFDGAAVYDMGESISLADDATYAFANHGATTFGVYAIKNNFNHQSQALFTYGSSIIDFSGGLSTLVAYGNGVNPDIDGKLNVWRDGATGRINIKNRLGSSRIFTLNGL